MSLDIVPTAKRHFRVYLYNDDEERGNNYIDIEQKFSDGPNICLCFPLEDKEKVYIIDRHDFVDNYDAFELDFITLKLRQ